MTGRSAFLGAASRHLLFTGKCGVGKTTIACATAVALADLGRRVLLALTAASAVEDRADNTADRHIDRDPTRPFSPKEA